ncbi:MAG: glycosyltransferase family 4 protein [Planctomycetota bacterium]|jgi:phosphatidylinositol alpha-mannosyltransferase
MKVLLLTKYDVLSGGIAQVLAGLARALRRAGVDVLVYSSDASAEGAELPGGVPCYHGPLPKPRFFTTLSAPGPLVGFCCEHGVDLIHCQGLYRPGYAARLVKMAASIPYVVTSQGDIVESSARMSRSRVRSRCRQILRDADAVTCTTQALVESAGELCPGLSGCQVIPNGLDLPAWESARRNAGDGGFVLTFGRLDEQKGFGVLIEAAAILAGRGVKAPLLIGGTGPMANQLKRQANQLGLSMHESVDALTAAGCGVCLPGLVVEGEPKRDLFRQAAMVAFPSLYGEGQPIVLLEAMAAGRAIIASDLPATRAMLGAGENCDLVPPGDANAWADAIAALLTDSDRRRRYETNSAARAPSYDWARIADQCVELYGRVLAGR